VDSILDYKNFDHRKFENNGEKSINAKSVPKHKNRVSKKIKMPVKEIHKTDGYVDRKATESVVCQLSVSAK